MTASRHQISLSPSFCLALSVKSAYGNLMFDDDDQTSNEKIFECAEWTAATMTII